MTLTEIRKSSNTRKPIRRNQYRIRTNENTSVNMVSAGSTFTVVEPIAAGRFVGFGPGNGIYIGSKRFDCSRDFSMGWIVIQSQSDGHNSLG